MASSRYVVGDYEIDMSETSKLGGGNFGIVYSGYVICD